MTSRKVVTESNIGQRPEEDLEIGDFSEADFASTRSSEMSRTSRSVTCTTICDSFVTCMPTKDDSL